MIPIQDGGNKLHLTPTENGRAIPEMATCYPEFLDSVVKPFDLKFMNRVHVPMEFIPLQLDTEQLKSLQLLHYMIKRPDEMLYSLGVLNQYQSLITMIISIEELLAPFLHDKYCYVTIDNRYVKKGTTQRQAGWHIDCLQGDEVPEKKPGNITFSWMDTLPTEYVGAPIDMTDLDVSKDQIFAHLAQRVDETKASRLRINHLQCFSMYCVHRPMVAPADTNRCYIRISYTHVPITSKKMTVNEDIKYPYEIHSTAGEIPKHLKLPGDNNDKSDNE